MHTDATFIINIPPAAATSYFYWQNDNDESKCIVKNTFGPISIAQDFPSQIV